MRKLFLPVMLATTFTLGGCAGGLGQDPLSGIIGTVLGGGLGGGSGYPAQGGYGNQNFEQAAVNACGQQASRYGRVSISNVQAVSSNTLRVYGTVEVNGYQRRNFTCSFRSDGRITGFDI